MSGRPWSREEAAIVLARKRARVAQPEDPLAARVRSAAVWKSCPWPHVAPPAWVFYRQPGFRRFLLPGLRAHLDAREAARRAQYTAEMAESARRWARTKALRKAAPMPLFEGAR
ncbi:hypothetical protein [Achromobacter aloeverae]